MHFVTRRLLCGLVLSAWISPLSAQETLGSDSPVVGGLATEIADEVTAASAGGDAEERVARKAVVPAGAEKPQVVYKGVTYVALSSLLKPIVDGKEPSTLAELRELEQQQARVAEAIKQVTVNIQQGSAQGSGVIITPDGYILTAARGGGPGRRATVILHDGRRLPGRNAGMNRDKDAGLVRIVEPLQTELPHATLGRSADLKVGQWCIGVGHPGGWQPARQ